MHAGEEMLRTKTDEKGEYVSDSVRSSDYVNAIKWSDLEKEEYYHVYEYYKGLIAFRKAHAAFTMSSRQEVLNKIQFIEMDDKQVIAYKLCEDSKTIYVIFNASKDEVEIKTGEKELHCYVSHEKAGLEILEKCSGDVKVPGVSCKVLISGE